MLSSRLARLRLEMKFSGVYASEPGEEAAVGFKDRASMGRQRRRPRRCTGIFPSGPTLCQGSQVVDAVAGMRALLLDNAEQGACRLHAGTLHILSGPYVSDDRGQAVRQRLVQDAFGATATPRTWR